MNTVMSMTPRKNKIRIKTHVGVVEAPLPDNVGFSVGSEYTAPFDANLLSGGLANAAILAGSPPSVGISTTKFYSSPEPSEISLDLEFHAYYSSREEVLIPVARLMVAALGIETTFSELSKEFQDMINTLRGMIGMQSVGTEEDDVGAEDGDKSLEEAADDLSELIGFIRAPRDPSVIYIGNICTLDQVYISSVTPQFSNVLDANGYPLSATVSLTAVFRKSPLAGDMAKAFSIGKVGQGALSTSFPRDGE